MADCLKRIGAQAAVGAIEEHVLKGKSTMGYHGPCILNQFENEIIYHVHYPVLL